MSSCRRKIADGNFVILSGCRARVDLAFVIDGSGSIEHYGRGNFRRCLNFVKAIVRRFNRDSGQTRIGVVLFSSRPRLIFRFGQYRRKSTILRVISPNRLPGHQDRICHALYLQSSIQIRTERSPKGDFCVKETIFQLIYRVFMIIISLFKTSSIQRNFNWFRNWFMISVR